MDSNRLRLIIIGVVALAVLGFGYALFTAIQKEGKQERWDILDKLRREGEPPPDRDPLWFGSGQPLSPERAVYIRRLENFLEKTAKETDDALEPQTRYIIAKTIADHLLSNPGLIDMAERGQYYEQAVAHLESIRDDFPDFPLNWTMLSREGFNSLTREFLTWLESNQKWESEHMLRAREPNKDLRVVIRTNRGDLLVGLYTELAPKWTAAFTKRAIAGEYDGTAFFSKRQIGEGELTEDHTVRAGGAMSRGLQDFDVEGHKKLTEETVRSGNLPEESRNAIPHTAGIMTVWHDPADEYDSDEQFMLCAADSPLLNYKYTPVGKLLDEDGFNSTETLKRIFASDTWSADKDVRDDTSLRGLLDLFQAPAQIVKVLVFEAGSLQEPPEGASPTKAQIEDKERALSSIEEDRYKTDMPTPPEKDEPKKGDEPKDDGAKDDGNEPAKDDK